MTDYALVTGGARNIGRAISERLKADGYTPIIIDVIEPEDPSLGDFIHLDLSDTAATADVLEKLIKDKSITRIVNNVGIFRGGPLEHVDLADFDTVMSINVRPAIQCSQALIPAMRAASFGRIVNISSRANLGHKYSSIYGASKAALAVMTKTWALELAKHGVTVNAVGPGPIDTDMLQVAASPGSNSLQRITEAVPVGRLGQPSDIANVVSFFLNEASSFVTGQLLYACGGMSLSR
jgi:NAD(P)-dependent dehydrogenase (short-subunit alcohol dehydrogenase family)